MTATTTNDDDDNDDNEGNHLFGVGQTIEETEKTNIAKERKKRRRNKMMIESIGAIILFIADLLATNPEIPARKKNSSSRK